jgi:AcrR family transcriptional regulator
MTQGNYLMKHPTRENLIRSAYELFYRQGFHAVGLDRIIQNAGVTKTTFYNHFDSKEALILAVMQWRNGLWPEQLRTTLRSRAGIRPRAQLMALFDVLDEVWGTDGYHGCLFIRAAAEFPLRHDPVHVVAHNFVLELASAIRELAAFAGARNPKALAAELLVLMAGSYAQSQMDDPANAAQVGKRLARRVLRERLPLVRRRRPNHAHSTPMRLCGLG